MRKIEDLLNEVNQDTLMEYVENIAKEVRLSGSTEELRAFKYVQQVLDDIGLETELMFSDAYISIPLEAKIVCENEEISCITHSMAKPTPIEGIEGKIVFLETLDDNASKRATGNIVLTEGLAVPHAVEWAETNDALGIIFINGDLTHEMIVSNVWGSPTNETFNELPSLPVFSVTKEVGNYLLNVIKFEKKITLYSKVDTGWRKIPTLIADLKVENDNDHFVLFSGHIDSWHYGAMDNGTANATMIEVARVLAANVNELRRSVKFAFWSGHSHGRYAGSTAYADNNWEELYENGVVHVNIDSVGAKDAVVLTQANCMEETKETVANAIRYVTKQEYEGTRYSRSGDQSFWGTGMPSALMGLSEQKPANNTASNAFAKLFGSDKSGGYGWWWHTVEDTLDKIDSENLKRDCQIYLHIIYDFASQNIIPINQLMVVNELDVRIKELSNLSNHKINFAKTINRINTLENRVCEIYDRIEGLSDNQKKKINHWMMKLSRILVPLNYLQGDRFKHDPCNRPECIASLSNIYKINTVEENTDEYYMLNIELQRKINKVNFSLLQAIRLSDETLDAIN